jgi:hypothetical protein
MVTVTAVVPEQPEVVPVTEYVVVDEGLAVTLDPVVPLKPVAGVQLYVVPPPAVNVTPEPPPQMAGGELTVIVGPGVTVTVTAAVPEQPEVVPVTVYVVVDVGFAVTLDPVVPLKPVEGVQL